MFEYTPIYYNNYWGGSSIKLYTSYEILIILSSYVYETIKAVQLNGNKNA